MLSKIKKTVNIILIYNKENILNSRKLTASEPQ